METFNTKAKKYDNNIKMFMDFDNAYPIARYDTMKYKQFDLLTEKQWSVFWRPEERVLTTDISDFKSLTKHEKFIFTENLKRQILLDSVQGRAPATVFAPIATLPEIETWIMAWTFFETIHSKSYTYIIQNLYANPSIVFDGIMDIKEIVDCAKDISKYYDDLDYYNKLVSIYGYGKTIDDPKKKGKKLTISSYDHKKKLWLAMNAVNALEGIRFYVSFACSWAFAENRKMVGNAGIIQSICWDENLHLTSTQKILSLLPSDDEDYVNIKKETEKEIISMFNDVIKQEKQWADYLFKDGALLGLNADILKTYVDYIAGKRMSAIGIKHTKTNINPLPWTNNWITGQGKQVAPQETEENKYLVGSIVFDDAEDTFKDFNLFG